MKYCNNCQRQVEPKTNWGFGGVLLALTLLGFGLIPGIIYIAHKQHSKSCPICNSKNWGVPPPPTEPKGSAPPVNP